MLETNFEGFVKELLSYLSSKSISFRFVLEWSEKESRTWRDHISESSKTVNEVDFGLFD